MSTSMRAWRECLGTCLICGQPVSAPLRVEEDPVNFDGRLLTEECPTRLCLMRFNALGERQDCHLIDDYTFLEQRRNGVSFRDEFARIEPIVTSANPAVFARFKQDVLDRTPSPPYDAAVATMLRIAARSTVCACRRCNKAMDRVGAHVNAVYRCFEATRDSDVPALETNGRDAIAAKKVIQQVALYFQYVGARWEAKPADRMLRDAARWRCIAHLANWGSTGAARFRLIALFHLSHLVYLGGTMRDVVPFTTWHVHCWRPFYMAAQYRADTFLDMRQEEVARVFDLAGRKHGAVWERSVEARAARIGDALMATNYHDNLRRGSVTLASEIIDEHALLWRHFNGRAADYLAFFRFNLPAAGCQHEADSRRVSLRHQCALLEAELVRARVPRPPRPRW